MVEKTANTIRVADRRDASSIADVHIASWRAAYSHVVPHALLYSAEFEANRRAIWTDWRFEPDQRVAVSVGDADGRIVGFATFGPERAAAGAHTGRGELYAFYFHPDTWGDGSAARLIDHVADRLGADGFDEAILWVLDDNPRARGFYRRHGWQPTGLASNYSFGNLELPEVEYRMQLTGRST